MCLYSSKKYNLNTKILDPAFYAALFNTKNSPQDNDQPNIRIADNNPQDNDQPNIIITNANTNKDCFGVSETDSSMITDTIKADLSDQQSSVQRVTVTETAAVTEAIMDWIYEDRVPEDPEILSDFYNAAEKFNIKLQCDSIYSLIKQNEGNTKLILTMTESALERKDENLLRILIPIFKSNDSLRRSPEYTERLGRYGLVLSEYYMRF